MQLRPLPVVLLVALAASVCSAPSTESTVLDELPATSAQDDTAFRSNPELGADGVSSPRLGSPPDRGDAVALADILGPLRAAAANRGEPHTTLERLDSVGIGAEVVEAPAPVLPADRRDPAAVASYVVTVWTNRAPRWHQWSAAIADWVTPQLRNQRGRATGPPELAPARWIRAIVA